MLVLLPPLNSDETYERLEAAPKDDQSTLEIKLKEGKPLISLTNKEPVWCEETGSYVLNFDGRVSMASIKNFQLVHPRDRTNSKFLIPVDDYIAEVFGRIGADQFSLDFNYPLTYVCALAIAMTTFDD